MAAHQLLEQNPENSKYRLGPVAFHLGLQYARQSDVLSTVSVYAERLCYKFGKSVNVCMLAGGQAVVVFKVDPDQVVMAYPEVGGVVSVHNSANGKILLAFADPDVRKQILDGYEYIKTTDSTITEEANFMAELERVQQSGIGFNRAEGVAGTYGVAGPIYNHRNEVIASFAISSNEAFFRENESRLVGEVKNTAQAVSRQLGYSGTIYR